MTLNKFKVHQWKQIWQQTEQKAVFDINFTKCK